MTRTIVAFACFSIFACGIAAGQEDAKPASEMTISEIMKEAHKKAEGAEKSLLVSVSKGEASDKDKERLLELYKSMANQEQPVGDADSWKEFNELLVTAAEGVVKGEEGAGKQLKKASNCMKCHKAHKPE